MDTVASPSPPSPRIGAPPSVEAVDAALPVAGQAPAPPVAPAPARPAPARTALRPRAPWRAGPPPPDVALPDVFIALAGFGALGLAAGLGSGVVEVAARSLPAAALVAAGTALLTSPPLLVGHQLAKMGAAPERLVGAVAGAFVQTGRVALALVPPMLFFSVTSSLWVPLFVVLGLLLMVVAGSSAARRLASAEDPEDSIAVGRLVALVLGWQTLALLVAVRLTFAATEFALLPTGGAW